MTNLEREQSYYFVVLLINIYTLLVMLSRKQITFHGGLSQS